PPGAPPKPPQDPDQSLIRVLGVLGRRAPEVEPTGEAQGVHDKVDRRRLAGDHGPGDRPIALQLPPGFGLESDRRPPGPQHAGAEPRAGGGVSPEGWRCPPRPPPPGPPARSPRRSSPPPPATGRRAA